jgi:hypothetical protein
MTAVLVLIKAGLDYCKRRWKVAAVHELAPARLGGDFRSTDKLAEETEVPYPTLP